MPIEPHRLVERTCDGCGAKWLLTGTQARFRPHKPFGRIAGRVESDIVKSEAYQQFSIEPGIELLDKIRSCPKCGLQNFAERPVTKKNPASEDADRGFLS